MVKDMKGQELLAGQTVIVHQDDEESVAVVIEVYPNRETFILSGHWVLIDRGDGAEGIMSYLLERTAA